MENQYGAVMSRENALCIILLKLYCYSLILVPVLIIPEIKSKYNSYTGLCFFFKDIFANLSLCPLNYAFEFVCIPEEMHF